MTSQEPCLWQQAAADGLKIAMWAPPAGIYAYGYDAYLNVRNSFPVFSTHIEANYVSKHEV